MKYSMLGLMLIGGLCVVPLNAQDRDHDQVDRDRAHEQNTRKAASKTYYDSAHKDRHEWNDNENSAWTRYREEHHVKESEFAKAKRNQQQEYWNWRHEHPDSH